MFNWQDKNWSHFTYQVEEIQSLIISFAEEFGEMNGVLLGGNCASPVVKDFDIYVAVGEGRRNPRRAFPWEPQSSVIDIDFHINDGGVPSDAKNFIHMIDWLIAKLLEGKKIHIGCIGGHGRTGIVVSAIVCKSMQIEDAITWTRNNYCPKAVETLEQVDFLNKYFEITKVKGSKEPYIEPRFDSGRRFSWEDSVSTTNQPSLYSSPYKEYSNIEKAYTKLSGFDRKVPPIEQELLIIHSETAKSIWDFT